MSNSIIPDGMDQGYAPEIAKMAIAWEIAKEAYPVHLPSTGEQIATSLRKRAFFYKEILKIVRGETTEEMTAN